VVYHHLNRSDRHEAQIESALERFQRGVFGLAAVRGAWFRRGSSRVFFVLAQENHAERLIKAVEEMESMAWCRDGHFVILPSASSERTAEVGPNRSTRIDVRIGNFHVENSTANPLACQHNVDPMPTSAAERISEARVVTVVLNDNGGLNLAANPWIAEIAVPCRLKTAKTTFTVAAAFQGRRDMYRTSPSTLNLARRYDFAGVHLSKSCAISFEAAIEQITTSEAT
jgi:hypothetical protein